MPSRLLVMSNGHGEDLIALRLIEALHRRNPGLDIVVLPLVGEGHICAKSEANARVTVVGPRLPLPSGGFSNQSLPGLMQDLAAGLPAASWHQWRLTRQWGRQRQPILAVGDYLPLLLAYSAGGPYGFIGTPKSDYTWASAAPPGWGGSPMADRYHRCKGSEWDPWEWTLMAHRRCQLVAVRDRLTARGLCRHGVRAISAGNPMADGFQSFALPSNLTGRRRLLLLPGSRMPEALVNARQLLRGLKEAALTEPTTVLLACGRQPDEGCWRELLADFDLPPSPVSNTARAIGAQACWADGPIEFLLGPGRFQHWAGWAEVALATAGTATEQVTGLGVPALSLPGPGPQFTAGFARRQSRLLGGAVLPCRSPSHLAERLLELLRDPALRHAMGKRGRQRIGPPGGSERLATLITHNLLTPGLG